RRSERRRRGPGCSWVIFQREGDSGGIDAFAQPLRAAEAFQLVALGLRQAQLDAGVLARAGGGRGAAASLRFGRGGVGHTYPMRPRMAATVAGIVSVPKAMPPRLAAVRAALVGSHPSSIRATAAA